MENNSITIKDFLTKHGTGALRPVSFHMPGHKGSNLYREFGYGEFLDNIMDVDITEIPGADNLFQPESVIRATMDRYKALYETKESYLLINGSSGGLIAAILASVPTGGKLIMARNCHKSVFNALPLGNITPVYAHPEVVAEYGILGEISAGEIARCLEENPDASAVVLPSPNYYGICSDIEAIAREVHKCGKILIVDQAHGAHLKFFGKWCKGMGYPLAAEEQGADAVINSTHKTLASFGQTAILNLTSDRIDKGDLEDRLQAIESSSPSYPLMATLDINAELLESNGDELICRWNENLTYFYEAAEEIPGLRLMNLSSMDKTKLNLDMSAYGIDGAELEKLLMERGIFIELITGNILMCMTGIGNKRCDFEKLISALKEIAAERELVRGKAAKQPCAVTATLEMEKVPILKERINLAEAKGRVCASSIIPYPPGIPIVCPGEVLDEEVVSYIGKLRADGEKVIGVDELGKIAVGRE